MNIKAQPFFKIKIHNNNRLGNYIYNRTKLYVLLKIGLGIKKEKVLVVAMEKN